MKFEVQLEVPEDYAPVNLQLDKIVRSITVLGSFIIVNPYSRLKLVRKLQFQTDCNTTLIAS